MTFGDTLKAENYLGMVMPLYASVAAVWVCSNLQRRKMLVVGYVLLAAIVAVQTTTLVEKLRVNPLRDAYGPVIAFLKARPSAQVDGDAVLGFGLGYDRLVDDERIGLYSGRKPELLVADRWYRLFWETVFWPHDLRSYYNTRKLLEREYHPVFTRGIYIIYQLNSWTPPDSIAAAAAK